MKPRLKARLNKTQIVLLRCAQKLAKRARHHRSVRLVGAFDADAARNLDRLAFVLEKTARGLWEQNQSEISL